MNQARLSPCIRTARSRRTPQSAGSHTVSGLGALPRNVLKDVSCQFTTTLATTFRYIFQMAGLLKSPDSSTNHMETLQSKDRRDLLNIIDDLRSQGISHYVDLPQVIVCGDQSSGKSSVLEALSGLKFPRKDNPCTRFATEVILRRGPEETTQVSIVPGTDRTDRERANLLAFGSTNVDLNHFERLVDSAREVMGIDFGSRAFGTDILRIEKSGPDQLHLTLVDLPGLFQAGNKSQTDDDAKAVTSLVLSYMQKTRSIILAVVSAKNDFANQIVTKYAREVDPDGVRTLGVITKPETLHIGSDSERAFITLAENNDVKFCLGWHVVRNRDYDTRDCSSGERDKMEHDFFTSGSWAQMS
jgi:GTPase SAR1 family protein